MAAAHRTVSAANMVPADCRPEVTAGGMFDAALPIRLMMVPEPALICACPTSPRLTSDHGEGPARTGAPTPATGPRW